jgi:hypothetical protein
MPGFGGVTDRRAHDLAHRFAEETLAHSLEVRRQVGQVEAMLDRPT